MTDRQQNRQDTGREDTAEHAVVVRLPERRTPSGVAALTERGLTTVEYAIGIVLVLSIVGLLIKASSQGWFLDLVKDLVGVVFKAITSGILG